MFRLQLKSRTRNEAERDQHVRFIGKGDKRMWLRYESNMFLGMKYPSSPGVGLLHCGDGEFGHPKERDVGIQTGSPVCLLSELNMCQSASVPPAGTPVRKNASLLPFGSEEGVTGRD